MDKPIRSTNHRRDWGHTVETVIGSLMLVGLGTFIMLAGWVIIDFTCWANDAWGPCTTIDPLGATLMVVGIAVMVLGPVIVVRTRQR